MSMRKLALITGASSGIGRDIARLAVADGYDLIIAADEPLIEVAAGLSGEGVDIQAVEADLATPGGIAELLAAASGRPIDVLVANAGHGLGHGFLDQNVAAWRHVIDTNITGTLLLLQPVLKHMVARGQGKVLITGSVAGHLAGSFQAVYNGTKAFIDSFAAAIGNELKHSGVTITCLKPGATDTNFFARAGMLDTKVGQAKKDDPADVAITGWEAMKNGEHSVVHGLKNKVQVLASGILSEATTAEMHRKQAEPGSSGSN
ncbi:MAG: SDR family NAD(P)-dependent oxidoreductase [Sphingopyxis sp.]|uniref:SDR family NAD(P)-dependent oxidoreductase n=1 Tax=Sphingopyxis sp. TaxID=1908224 RepID=UPI003D80C6D6